MSPALAHSDPGVPTLDAVPLSHKLSSPRSTSAPLLSPTPATGLLARPHPHAAILTTLTPARGADGPRRPWRPRPPVAPPAGRRLASAPPPRHEAVRFAGLLSPPVPVGLGGPSLLRSTATQAAIEEASAALKDEAAVLPRERMANSHLTVHDTPLYKGLGSVHSTWYEGSGEGVWEGGST